MSNLISFTTPLGSAGTATSGPFQIQRAQGIIGTVYADQAGTAYVDQGGDGINWDYTTAVAVAAQTGTDIDVEILGTWFQVRYVNGGSAQTVFRLYANVQDQYGAFLQNVLPPSEGGAFAILLWNPAANTYVYVGRFDGTDAFNACTNAAVFSNTNGKYAAFAVADAVVTDETITRGTNHAQDSF